MDIYKTLVQPQLKHCVLIMDTGLSKKSKKVLNIPG